MLNMLPGALLLFLSLSGDLVFGEISRDFSQCSQFFYEGTPPSGITGDGYQPICQRYKNQYRFASLYDREHRVSLYSAYILRLGGSGRPKGWMYEPQLVSTNNSPDMQRIPKSPNQTVIDSQAVLGDYNISGYTKGHLNPNMHQETMDDRKATFTLTNIVPQMNVSNSGPWNVLETRVSERYKEWCNGTMYVITGTIPFDPVRLMNNRVPIPEYMWSAYCCPSYNTNLSEPMQPFVPTYAAVGRNDPNSPDDIVNKSSGFDVRQMPLHELEDILQRRLNINIQLFYAQCQHRRKSSQFLIYIYAACVFVIVCLFWILYHCHFVTSSNKNV